MAMSKSVELAYLALTSTDKTEFDRQHLLKEAIELAYQCFKDWCLTDDALNAHILELKSFGAVACKPTGSGSGGYVLSLWSKEPPPEMSDKLIPA